MLMRVQALSIHLRGGVGEAQGTKLLGAHLYLHNLRLAWLYGDSPFVGCRTLAHSLAAVLSISAVDGCFGGGLHAWYLTGLLR